MGVKSAQKDIELFSQLKTGVVSDRIDADQPGRVWYRATYWPACLYNLETQDILLPNMEVIIVGRRGITLLVRPKP